ncbi:hypothetical protein AURDEDRAFT_166296 [Auricularia subglabra TFB-10046 SS5]|uniref:JmjC domain-containing protein n=1 Tax=Auricularia subglabra (strain TFB-10046 / SS5) TaxID=717982 RepID=J0WYZ1_AURST|nr:hypothetical protein AURDEDRAFT_166296 [Auricularia subglabra TFB-10046 SS5]
MPTSQLRVSAAAAWNDTGGGCTQVYTESHNPRTTSGPPAIAPRAGIRGGFAIRGSELSSNAEVIPMLVDQKLFYVCLPYISRKLYEDGQIKTNYDNMIREIKAVVGGLSPALDVGFVSYYAAEPGLPQRIAEALGRNCVQAVKETMGKNLFGRRGSLMDMPASYESYHELAHSGYYTPSSHDGHGYCTYTWVHSGVKLWSWQRLIPSHISRRADALKGFSRSALDSPGRVVDGSWFTLMLEPGDVLIQPPNIIHRVYTAERSIVQRGDFFCWHALHLAEMARHVSTLHNLVEVDKDILTTRRLAKMALSLSLGYKSSPFGVPERSLLALLRMVAPQTRHPQAAQSGSPDNTTSEYTTERLQARAFNISLRPEAEDDASDWSDLGPDAGPDLSEGSFCSPRPLDLEVRQGKFSDLLSAEIVARLYLLLLDPDSVRRYALDSYDQPGLSWDAPGPPLPCLRSLPIGAILQGMHVCLQEEIAMAPEGWDEEDISDSGSYVLDGVREYQHVAGIVKEIEKNMDVP